MKKITILTVGNLKDKFLIDGCNEFLKRLTSYAQIEVIEVKEEVLPSSSSPSLEEAIKDKEGERLLAKLPSNSYCIALDLNHPQMDSLKLAQNIDKWLVLGGSHIYFVIGGSLGLSNEIKKRANAFLTLSSLTFTHRFSRLILLEAIYRSFRILNNEPYHK